MNLPPFGAYNGTELRDASGWYNWPEVGGERFLSVTKIIGNASKPHLQKWYAKMERARMLETLKALKTREVTIGQVQTDLSGDQFVPAAEIYRDSRADFGVKLHDELEHYVVDRHHGLPYEFDRCGGGELLQCMQAYHRWFEQHKPEYLMIEAPVFNRREGYAGTLDAVVKIGQMCLIMDYKSSKRTNTDHALQMAAYRAAEFVGLRRTGQEFDMPETTGGMLMLVKKTGVETYRWPCGQDELLAFTALQHYGNWAHTVETLEEKKWL